MVIIREAEKKDIPALRELWNAIVDAGDAFPQMEMLSVEEAGQFFAGQSFTGVAERNGEPVGLYILHPNNVGRCGHLANGSYAVREDMRGCGVGEALVRHSLTKARELGFRVLQFNAVTESNRTAIRLYEKLGFIRLGSVPGGFLKADGSYEDIVLFYHLL